MSHLESQVAIILDVLLWIHVILHHDESSKWSRSCKKTSINSNNTYKLPVPNYPSFLQTTIHSVNSLELPIKPRGHRVLSTEPKTHEMFDILTRTHIAWWISYTCQDLSSNLSSIISPITFESKVLAKSTNRLSSSTGGARARPAGAHKSSIKPLSYSLQLDNMNDINQRIVSKFN